MESDTQVIDKIGLPEVMDFILGKLESYDTSNLDWIKLLPLNKKAILHGRCDYPKRTRPRARTFVHGFRIRASVNIRTELYPANNTHWARIPDTSFKQGWRSDSYTWTFQSVEEAALHTLAHEVFHFLSKSKQVPHKNVEANANWWADAWLEEWKQEKQQCPTGPKTSPKCPSTKPGSGEPS